MNTQGQKHRFNIFLGVESPTKITVEQAHRHILNLLNDGQTTAGELMNDSDSDDLTRVGSAVAHALVIEVGMAVTPYTRAQGLFEFTTGPDHLMYLLDIYRGQFDDRVQLGMYKHDQNYHTYVQDLLRGGLINYTGAHVVTPLGTARVLAFLGA